MTSKDFAIGVLSTTAVILLVGLLVILSRPATAFASGMTASMGRYVLTVGNVQIGNEELLYVLDTVDQKMIAYRFNGAKKQIVPVWGDNLARFDGDSQNNPPARGPKKGRRRP